MTVQIQWHSDIPNAIKRVDAAKRRAVAILSSQAKQSAIQAIISMRAVDTGALRDSIKIRNSGRGKASVYTKIPYAIYVHDGTATMSARPFFAVAIRDIQRNVASVMKEALKAAPLGKGTDVMFPKIPAKVAFAPPPNPLERSD